MFLPSHKNSIHQQEKYLQITNFGLNAHNQTVVEGTPVEDLHPLRQFTGRLLLILGAGALLLSLTAAELIDSSFVRDTAHATQEAVATHFAYIFPTDLITQGAATASSGSEHAGHNAYSSPGEGDDAIDKMVRLHFGLYNIVHATFYRPDGTATYSYSPSATGARATGRTWERVQTALGGATGVYAESTQPTGAQAAHPTVRLFIPVRQDNHGPVIGVVEAVRDMTPVRAAVRAIQLTVTGVTFVIALGLFLSLRRTYAKSTEAIRSRTEALGRALTEVETTYDATLQALSSALDTRDSETEHHSLRVTAYADRLAQELGLDPAEREVLRRGAILHDVGKIGVPDAILRKPGALNDAEWQQMRRHPELGAQMLAGIGFVAPALPVVRHHHERWNGAGYPDRLVGEQIPLHARIFAIADTLDAITSDRPYRAARPVDEARAEIVRCAGSQFDPRVVTAFMAVPEQEWLDIARSVKPIRVGRSA